MTNLNKKIINATKWSSFTELITKIITPVINIILARILSPEEFGIVATVTMIISFAEMFTDSGFQKFLIQHEFASKEEKKDSENVAFWTNFIISLFLWTLIFLFNKEIAALVGNPGLGYVLVVSAIQLPLTSFSSIQMSIYKRELDFKSIFTVKIATAFIPLFVTIPLAIFGLSYWSIIIGNIIMQIVIIVILTIKTKWRPTLSYSFNIFLKMFSFSLWSLMESVSIWLTIWVDTFIIGRYFDAHFLGLYKTSSSMVNTLMSVITMSTTPVLFSGLSRLQNEKVKFNNLFYMFQSLASVILFPLGVGIFLFSDLATYIILGSQWGGASPIIGHWALTSSILIVFGYYSSEVYRAKGKPKLSFYAQLLHLIILIPVCFISAQFGFWALVYARSWIRLQFILVHFFILKYKFDIEPLRMLKNVYPSAFAATLMGLLGFILLKFLSGLVNEILVIFICTLFYFSILLAFPRMRNELIKLKLLIKNV